MNQAAYNTGLQGPSLALEKHYSVPEIAAIWGLSENTIRSLFRDRPGVLQTQVRTLRSRKRQNITLRIPESVLLAVHREMTVKFRVN